MDFYFLFDFRIINLSSVPDHVYLWFRFLVFYKILIMLDHIDQQLLGILLGAALKGTAEGVGEGGGAETVLFGQLRHLQVTAQVVMDFRQQRAQAGQARDGPGAVIAQEEGEDAEQLPLKAHVVLQRTAGVKALHALKQALGQGVGQDLALLKKRMEPGRGFQKKLHIDFPDMAFTPAGVEGEGRDQAGLPRPERGEHIVCAHKAVAPLHQVERVEGIEVEGKVPALIVLIEHRLDQAQRKELVCQKITSFEWIISLWGPLVQVIVEATKARATLFSFPGSAGADRIF